MPLCYVKGVTCSDKPDSRQLFAVGNNVMNVLIWSSQPSGEHSGDQNRDTGGVNIGFRFTPWQYTQVQVNANVAQCQLDV